MQQPRKIGLIGGLALRAGIFYYEQIAQRFAAISQEPLQLVLAHADVGKVLAFVRDNDKPELGRYLASLGNELFDAGAELVAITAIAPHFAIAEVAQFARGPLVNVLDTIPTGLKAAGLCRVAVFGNRAVMDTDVYGSIPVQAAVKLPPSLVNEIHAIYSSIALDGKRGTEAETRFLGEAARALIETGGAEAIVLAGTDLSSFYAEQPPAFPYLDVARLHIDQIVQLARLGSGATEQPLTR
jgi:aspartate/glutamate racemase